MRRSSLSDRRSGLKYFLLATLVLAVAVGGFFAFVIYLELDLANFAGSGLFLLGIVAGIASFFSPCSFPLLVTLLARETEVEKATKNSFSKALQFAASLAVGVSAFLLLAGALLAVGSGPLMRRVTFTSTPGRVLRAVVGVLLIALGLFQAKGLRFGVADRIRRPLQRFQARIRRRSPNLGFVLFGFGYVLAGFG